MQEISKFFSNLNKKKDDINIAKLGVIDKVYENGLYADIQPLPREDNPLILEVPLAFHRNESSYLYMPYEKDDIVLLLFVDVNIDNLLLGADDLASDIVHADNDCICITRISTEDQEVIDTDDDVDDTIIKHGKSKITMKKNGDITIQGRNIRISGSIESSTWK